MFSNSTGTETEVATIWQLVGSGTYYPHNCAKQTLINHDIYYQKVICMPSKCISKYLTVSICSVKNNLNLTSMLMIHVILCCECFYDSDLIR